MASHSNRGDLEKCMETEEGFKDIVDSEDYIVKTIQKDIKEKYSNIDNKESKMNEQDKKIKDYEYVINDQYFKFKELKSKMQERIDEIKNKEVKINEQQSIIKDQNCIIVSKRNTITAIDSKCKELDSAIKNQNGTIKILESKLIDQNNKMKTHERIVKELYDKYKDQCVTIENKDSRIKIMDTKLEDQACKVKNLDYTIREQKCLIKDQDCTIEFYKSKGQNSTSTSIGIDHNLDLQALDSKAKLQDSIIKEQDNKIHEQDLKIQEQDLKMNEKDMLLNKHQSKIKEKDLKLSEHDSKNKDQALIILEEHFKMKKMDSKIAELELELERQNLKIEEQDCEGNDNKDGNQCSEIEEQNSIIKQQSANIDDQDSKIKLQSAKIEGLNSKIKIQSIKIKEYDNKMSKQSMKMKELDSKIRSQSITIKERDSKIRRQSSKINEQDSKMKEDHFQVFKLIMNSNDEKFKTIQGEITKEINEAKDLSTPQMSPISSPPNAELNFDSSTKRTSLSSNTDKIRIIPKSSVVETPDQNVYLLGDHKLINYSSIIKITFPNIEINVDHNLDLTSIQTVLMDLATKDGINHVFLFGPDSWFLCNYPEFPQLRYKKNLDINELANKLLNILNNVNSVSIYSKERNFVPLKITVMIPDVINLTDLNGHYNYLCKNSEMEGIINILKFKKELSKEQNPHLKYYLLRNFLPTKDIHSEYLRKLEKKNYTYVCLTDHKLYTNFGFPTENGCVAKKCADYLTSELNLQKSLKSIKVTEEVSPHNSSGDQQQSSNTTPLTPESNVLGSSSKSEENTLKTDKGAIVPTGSPMDDKPTAIVTTHEVLSEDLSTNSDEKAVVSLQKSCEETNSSTTEGKIPDRIYLLGDKMLKSYTISMVNKYPDVTVKIRTDLNLKIIEEYLLMLAKGNEYKHVFVFGPNSWFLQNNPYPPHWLYYEHMEFFNLANKLITTVIKVIDASCCEQRCFTPLKITLMVPDIINLRTVNRQMPNRFNTTLQASETKGLHNILHFMKTLSEKPVLHFNHHFLRYLLPVNQIYVQQLKVLEQDTSIRTQFSNHKHYTFTDSPQVSGTVALSFLEYFELETTQKIGRYIHEDVYSPRDSNALTTQPALRDHEPQSIETKPSISVIRNCNFALLMGNESVLKAYCSEAKSWMPDLQERTIKQLTLDKIKTNLLEIAELVEVTQVFVFGLQTWFLNYSAGHYWHYRKDFDFVELAESLLALFKEIITYSSTLPARNGIPLNITLLVPDLVCLKAQNTAKISLQKPSMDIINILHKFWLVSEIDGVHNMIIFKEALHKTKIPHFDVFFLRNLLPVECVKWDQLKSIAEIRPSAVTHLFHPYFYLNNGLPKSIGYISDKFAKYLKTTLVKLKNLEESTSHVASVAERKRKRELSPTKPNDCSTASKVQILELNLKSSAEQNVTESVPPINEAEPSVFEKSDFLSSTKSTKTNSSDCEDLDALLLSSSADLDKANSVIAEPNLSELELKSSISEEENSKIEEEEAMVIEGSEELDISNSEQDSKVALPSVTVSKPSVFEEENLNSSTKLTEEYSATECCDVVDFNKASTLIGGQNLSEHQIKSSIFEEGNSNSSAKWIEESFQIEEEEAMVIESSDVQDQ